MTNGYGYCVIYVTRCINIFMLCVVSLFNKKIYQTFVN